MRITNSMMQNQVLFNMQRSITRFMDMQTNMSSGRRINKPSDDPTGTLQDLGYRSELSKIAQYQKNVNKALSRMGVYDNTLADMKNLVTSAKDVAVAMANGTYDDVARMAEADEIQSIFDQLIQLGNTEFDGSRIYSGFNTRTSPFTVAANGVIYVGDEGKIKFEVESGLSMAVNFTGSEVLMAPTRNLGAGTDLNVGLTTGTLVDDLNHGVGIDMPAGGFTITDKNLNITATIDLNAGGGVASVGDLVNRINADLAANVPPITSLTAVISDAGSSIKFETVKTGRISDATSLAVLNGGRGVDLDPSKLVLSNGTGISVTVDFAGATTVGNIRSIFNGAMASSGIPELANVTMGINAAVNGFQINDGNAVPIGLTISPLDPMSTLATDLGISGSMGAQMIGLATDPVVSFAVAETSGSTAADLGILASFKSDYDGTDLDPILTPDSLLSALNNRSSYDFGEIRISHGDTSLALDLSDPAILTIRDVLNAINNSGLNIAASIGADGRGLEIVNNDTTRSLIIEDVSDKRTAKQLGLFGGGDVFGTLMILVNTLRSDDQEGTGMLLEHLDEGIQRLLQARGTAGSQAVRLENTSSRLVDQHFNFTTRLSGVEDADFNKLITDLSTHENIYQASLLASAKIIQPTLMDFLR